MEDVDLNGSSIDIMASFDPSWSHLVGKGLVVVVILGPMVS